MGLSLALEAGERLGLYAAELEKWSRKMNLVGPAPLPEIIDKHFLDSLTLLPLLAEQSLPDLLDVGTGAGFPGLVLKAVLPQLAVTLVEPRQKRAAFLRHIIRTLELREIAVVEARLRTDGTTPLPRPGGYHLVTARALSEIAPFLALIAPYCLPGGHAVCMKGSRWQEELESWQQTENGEFVLAESREWRLPFSGDYRCLLLFRKERAGWK
ncbi:MAG: 16S rRNA (guanine(527)-N(7))-methyltransferase RsmG [Desulfobacteraceae bacterium]|nr:16S rRNA (guanine(527)-N(7))-methyltransferase RsmG [Desulfobacteraceae bacterium]